MWKLSFLRKEPPRADLARVKALALAALGHAEDVSVSVSEIACEDPGCSGTETIILVMRAGHRTAACKVSKEAAEVDDDDVRDALRTLA